MDENANKVFSNKVLKETTLNNIKKSGNIKHADFILHLIYITASVDIDSDYITAEEIDKIIDKYHQYRYMPRNIDMEFLDTLNFYKNIDVRKDIVIGGHVYNIEKYYKALINDILQHNPSLLTLGKNAIRYDEDGIKILDDLLDEDIEKQVDKIMDKNHHINCMIDIDKKLNLIPTLTDYLYSIDSNTRNIFIQADEIKDENIKDTIQVSIKRERQTKKERIINYFKFGISGQYCSYKQIAELVGTTDKYVKKVIHEYNIAQRASYKKVTLKT